MCRISRSLHKGGLCVVRVDSQIRFARCCDIGEFARHDVCFAMGDLIRSRAVVRLLGVAVLAIPLVGATLLRPTSQSAGVPLSGSSTQLDLRNNQWDAVRVEVRVGTADSCDQITDAWVRTLGKGQAWAIVGDLPVCWRSEVASGSATAAATWTAWSRPVLVVGAVTSADL